MFPRESPPPRSQPPAEGVNVKPRTLGSTGYGVSELGFGGWGLGGSQWRGVDDGQGRDALRAAVDRGITFFDTALAYGDGHSERLMGQALKPEIHAGRVVVATKVPPRNEEWPGRAGAPLADVFPARHLSASTERSLQNLGVDAEVLERSFRGGGEMRGRKDVCERRTGPPWPFLVPRRDLGSDDHATSVDFGLQGLAHEALAMAVPVRQGGIEERDPSVHGCAQGITSLAIVHAAPL